MLAYHVNTRGKAVFFLAEGMPSGSHWYPADNFKENISRVEVITAIINKLEKSYQSEPIVVISREVTSADEGFVEDFLNKWSKSVSLSKYLANQINFKAPRITIKNSVPKNELRLESSLKEFLSN